MSQLPSTILYQINVKGCPKNKRVTNCYNKWEAGGPKWQTPRQNGSSTGSLKQTGAGAQEEDGQWSTGD